MSNHNVDKRNGKVYRHWWQIDNETGERGMSETGHTPGPWHASPDAVPEYHVQITVHAENGDRVATVFDNAINKATGQDA